MKKRHRSSQQASSASQRQGKKDKGVGTSNSSEKSAGSGVGPVSNAAATLKSKYYKGTITRDEIPELLTRLEVWSREDILLALSVMRENPSDPEFQHRCLQVLVGDGKCDIMNHGTTEILIGVSGGIELILSAMRTFKDSRDIQECGCYALTRLIIIRENLRKFVRFNGFEMFIWHIHHSSTPLTYIRTLKYAIALLLSNRSTEKLVQPFIAAGGIEAVFTAMRAALTNEVLAYACLSLLSTLSARKADAVVARVSRMPLGVETIAAVMVLYPHSRGVQTSAGALVQAVLTRSPRWGDRFCAADGAPAVLAGIMHHRDRPATVGALLGVLELAAELSPAFQDTVRELKGIDLLMGLHGKYEGNNKVQLGCFRALAALARGSYDGQMAVEGACGVVAALFGLKKWEKSQRKTMAMCEALFDFTWANPQTQEALCIVQGANVMARFIGVHCKTSRVTVEALAKVIVSVLSTERLHEDYCTDGIIRMMDSALETYPDSFVLRMSVDCLKRVVGENRPEGCSAVVCKELGQRHKGNTNYNWCQGCCSPQLLYRCITCDGGGNSNGNNGDGEGDDKRRSTKVYCKYCWEKYHNGHTGVEMLTVGSCSSIQTSLPSSSSNTEQAKTKT